MLPTWSLISCWTLALRLPPPRSSSLTESLTFFVFPLPQAVVTVEGLESTLFLRVGRLPLTEPILTGLKRLGFVFRILLLVPPCSVSCAPILTGLSCPVLLCARIVVPCAAIVTPSISCSTFRTEAILFVIVIVIFVTALSFCESVVSVSLW